MPALGAEIAKTFRRLRPGNVWLGWQDSNLRMTESKSVALPLGDIPMYAASEQGHLTDETRMGWMKGFEPSASRATIWRANQLRHTHHSQDSLTNVPEGIRTPDPRLRRPLLYPAELQTHQHQILMQERVMGIEPTYPAWKAGVLPLNYTRILGLKESG